MKEPRYFDKSELKVPTEAFVSSGDQISVEIYMEAKNVPIWERGGKRAYAVKRGKQVATEKQFDDLFQSY